MALNGCAPLSHATISLDGSDPLDPASVAMIEVIETNPDRGVVIQGVDHRLVTIPRTATILRTWSFALAPGSHVLFLSSVPAGLPWLPQSIECFIAEARVDSGVTYVLRMEGTPRAPVLARKDTAEIIATGRLVDRAPVMLRRCRWQQSGPRAPQPASIPT